MASELDWIPRRQKRAGLLHDIGKVPDEEPELPHALYGMKLAGEIQGKKPDISAMPSVLTTTPKWEILPARSPIVQVCDTRLQFPARREMWVKASHQTLDNDLEQLAMSYPGVTKKTYYRAGRELRVIVGAVGQDWR